MKGACFAMGATALVLASGPALAVDWEVTGDVTAQGYDIVSPWGDVVLGRRRLTSTLGLASYNLQGGDYQPFKPTYSVQLRLRVDTDFGIQGDEYKFDPSNPTRFVPGLQFSPVDLMYGFVEGRNLAGGVLDFKVGRQYTTNVLGWWSFDGGLVRVTTPFFFDVEAYGGLEQRGGLPLSTARFESMGVWRGSGNSLLAQNSTWHPSFQEAAVAPAFGFALESNGPNWIHGRLDYRRVYNTGDAFTGPFGFPDQLGPNGVLAGTGGFDKVSGLRISTDQIGYALTAYLSTIGALRGGFVYDLYDQHVSRAYGSLDFFAGKRTTFGLDGEYLWPVFDADSIFNWFSHDPSASAMARVSTKPIDRFQLSASAGTKLWLSDGDAASWAIAQCTASGFSTPDQLALCTRYGLDTTNNPSSPSAAYGYAHDPSNLGTRISPDLVANLDAAYAWTSGHADLRAMLETGFGDDGTALYNTSALRGPIVTGATSGANNRGRREGGTVSAVQAVVPGVFWLGGRVSTYDWHDPTRPDRDATSFGYVVAPEVQPVSFGKLRVEWEHDMNRLIGQSFRLLGIITMRVAP